MGYRYKKFVANLHITKIIWAQGKHDERSVRKAEVDALVKIGTPAIKPLFTTLHNGMPSVRSFAVEVLGRIGDASVVEPLIGALRDESKEVREAASTALTEILPDWPRSEAAKRQVPEFITALQLYEDSGLRACAVYTLGQIGDKRAVNPLIKGLRDQDARIRVASAEVLDEIAPDWPQSEVAKAQVPQFISALKSKDSDVRRTVIKVLGKIGDVRILEPVTMVLSDQDPYVRFAAVKVLIKLGTPAIESLITALRNGNSAVRQGAAEALETIDSDWCDSDVARRQVPEFISALQGGREVGVRKVAATTLGKIGDPRALSTLAIALGDQDADVRVAATDALVKFGTQAVEWLIVIALPDVRSRAAAIEALVRIGTSTTERLITALRDQDPIIRQAADEALRIIDPKWPQSEVAQRQITEFIAALNDADWNVREGAVKALGEISGPAALEPLVFRLSDEDSRVRLAAAEALKNKVPDWPQTQSAKQHLPKFFTALQDTDWNVRERAVEVLGKIGDFNAVDALIDALRDRDSRVRSAAAKALGQLHDIRSSGALIAALRDWRQEVREIVSAMLENNVPDWPHSVEAQRQVPNFIAALEGGGPDIRAVAANTLGKIGDYRALGALLAALRSQDSPVRAAALEALNNIAPDWPQSEAAKQQVTEFIAALRDEDLGVRIRTVEVLKTLGKTALPGLVSALIDPSPKVRNIVAETLYKIAPNWWQIEAAQRQVPYFVTALRDKNSDVCRAALDALDKVAPDWPRSETAKQQLPEFIAALQYGDWNVRANAAKTLGRIGDARALEPLIDALRDRRNDVRAAATVALGQLRNVRNTGTLIAALRDWRQDVRAAVTTVLEKHAPDWPHSEEAKQQVPAFITALQSRGADIREAAARALGKIGELLALAPLVTALRDPIAQVRIAAAEAADKIALDHGKPNSVLEEIVNQASEFIEALGSSDPGISEVAKRLLRLTGDVRLIDPLIAALRDVNQHKREAAFSILSATDPAWAKYEVAIKQVPDFIANLEDKDPGVRETAVVVLGIIGDARAVDSLYAQLNDKNSSMRMTTIKALNKLRDGNEPLLGSYPNLVCRACRFRAEKRILRKALLENETWIVCRGCGSSARLIKNVEEIVGVIGGDDVYFWVNNNIATVSLWNEIEQTAHNADIDSLVVRNGNVRNYERAVNAVINILNSDVSRPVAWCKKIPVVLEGDPVLSIGAMRMLEDTFMSVQKE